MMINNGVADEGDDNSDMSEATEASIIKPAPAYEERKKFLIGKIEHSLAQRAEYVRRFGALLHDQVPPLADGFPEEARAALERLIEVAKGYTDQSSLVADFLLAWWNAAECGGYNPTRMWGLDAQIAKDQVTVFQMISVLFEYPDTLGYERAFQIIQKKWRVSEDTR
jgi:hypothetical protein